MPAALAEVEGGLEGRFGAGGAGEKLPQVAIIEIRIGILVELSLPRVVGLQLDVEEIEARMKKERLFSSTNRWISSSEIKNGYVVANRHLDLLADAVALDIIVV